MAVSGNKEGGVIDRLKTREESKTMARKNAKKNPRTKSNSKLYAAYGSNMNLEQMAYRCPTARVVGMAWLKDYRLLFRGDKENAHATVEPHDGGAVPIVLWEITPTDEMALDRYEGYPTYYRKENVRVEMNGTTTDDEPTETMAMVYIMNVNEGTKYYRPLSGTNPWYYATIREGYKSAGFDLAILEQATVDSIEPSDDIWGRKQVGN